MSSSNGHKRPFGPHGEGCDCAPEETPAPETLEESEEQEPEETVEETAVARGPSLIDPIFGAVADSMAVALWSALEVCVMDGHPMNGRQVTYLISGLMQGYAGARETSKNIERNYWELMAAHERAAKAQETAEEAKTELENVADLFSRGPEKTQ